MKGFWTIYRKELQAIFNTAIAYIFIVAFLLIQFIFYTQKLFKSGRAEMREFFGIELLFILSIFVPAVTMRLWAEEHRQGTIELLMTLPMKLFTVVCAKFAAAMTFLACTLAGSLAAPLILALKWQADVGPIVSGYVGVGSLGMLFIALGMYISAHTRDQITAFVLTFLLCLCTVLVGFDYFTNTVDGWIPGVGTFVRLQFGAETHLEPFAKGVLSISDVFYFLSLTGMFVALTQFALSARTNVRERTRFDVAGALVVGIGLALALNFNEARVGRVDLTRNHLYSLSPSSKKILRGLKAPVTVTYYFKTVEGIDELRQLERDVGDLLREMAASSGQIVLRFEDAAKSEVEAKLKEKNIEPGRVQKEEKEQVTAVLTYSALTISYLHKEDEVISWVGPRNLDSLEFELMSRIHKLSLDRKPKVSLFGKGMDINMMQMQMRMMGQMPRDEYGAVSGALRDQGYDVDRVNLTASELIPGDADLLLVLEPEEMNERQLYEINKWLRSGHPAIFAIQRFRLDVRPMGNRLGSSRAVDPKIDPLLLSWGVTVDDAILMDAGCFGIHNPLMDLDIPPWIRIGTNSINRESGITNGVGFLVYFNGSHLKIDAEAVKKAGLSPQVLVTSGPKSWTAPASKMFLDAADIETVRDKYLGNLPLIVQLEGTFPDAFAGKPVPAWPSSDSKDKDEKKDSAATPDKPSPAKVILCGSAQMFSQQLMEEFPNRTFLLNAVDLLTHGEDLASIRGKRFDPKMIGSLSDTERLLYRLTMIGSGAVVLIVLGLIKLVFRRQRRAAYQRAYSRV